MTDSVYNFCAGPSALPQVVMQKAQAEFLNWQGLGVSVMEMSHRSDEYQALAKKAEANFRQLLSINDDYTVLFLHGGATLQFSNIPMSLCSQGAHDNQRTHNNKNAQAEYICNGMWSSKAATEAARFGNVHTIDVVGTDDNGIRFLKPVEAWQRASDPIYIHYTPNETIEGIRFPEPIKSSHPVVADMSSCILSEQIEIDDYDFIYAGAQKNIGSAGLTIAVIKRELFAKMNFQTCPKTFNYVEQDKQGSMVNTPPTFAWYLASLVFEWVVEQGGVNEMEKRALEKSQLLYQCIDEDDFYTNPIAIKDRSRMNVPFIMQDESLNKTFLSQAKENNLVGLAGHRSVGGMRASLYNSMSVAGVKALTDFMREFKQRYG